MPSTISDLEALPFFGDRYGDALNTFATIRCARHGHVNVALVRNNSVVSCGCFQCNNGTRVYSILIASDACPDAALYTYLGGPDIDGPIMQHGSTLDALAFGHGFVVNT